MRRVRKKLSVEILVAHNSCGARSRIVRPIKNDCDYGLGELIDADYLISRLSLISPIVLASIIKNTELG
jgi:hypothetical protein